jgi:opacity protein-like surface antigen
MNKKIFVSTAAMILLLSISTGYAQSGFFLGLQGGYSAQKPQLSSFEFNTDTTYLYGVRAGVKVWAIALEVNFFQAAHNIALVELDQHEWDGRQVDYNFIGGNLKYFFPLAFFHPYITIGYGYYTANINQIDKDTDSGYNFGLGFELHLGKKFSLLVEGKYHRVKLYIDELDLKIGDFTASGGFNIYL